MNSLRMKFAAVALAIAAMVAAPAAAHAYTPNNPNLTSSGQLTPGGSVTFGMLSFDNGTVPKLGIYGNDAASINPASVVAALSSSPTFNGTPVAGGISTVTVRFPATASGNYDVTATGLKNGAPHTEKTRITISTGGGQVPAATGVDSASLMGVWIGGGVLLLGGLAVTVFAVRRQRQDA